MRFAEWVKSHDIKQIERYIEHEEEFGYTVFYLNILELKMIFREIDQLKTALSQAGQNKAVYIGFDPASGADLRGLRCSRKPPQ